MRKVLSVLVAAVMLAALCVPAFAAAKTVTMSVDKTQVKVGQTVTVKVNADKVTGVNATVTYNTDAFELVSAKAQGGLTLIFNTEVPGQVLMAGAGTEVVAGTVAVITLKYKGGEGKIALDDVTVLIGDEDAETPVAGSTATVVEASGTDPVPAKTTKPAANNGGALKTTKENKKTGGTVSVAASATAVVVMAAAVAYTMKKKNED